MTSPPDIPTYDVSIEATSNEAGYKCKGIANRLPTVGGNAFETWIDRIPRIVNFETIWETPEECVSLETYWP